MRSTCAVASSTALKSPARSPAAIWSALRRVKSVVKARRASVAVFAEDRRDDEVVARALRRQTKNLLAVEAGPDHVVAQDVLELDRLGGRRDVLSVELGKGRVLINDVV